MEIDLTLKNYRAFSDRMPARISIRPGFTAFVGVNNAGKSSLLKFFYEFRPMFEVLASPSSVFHLVQGESIEAYTSAPFDQVFHDRNDRNLVIQIRLPEAPPIGASGHSRTIRQANITVSRQNQRLAADFGLPHHLPQNLGWTGTLLGTGSGNIYGDFSPIFNAFQSLTQALYIGPFRNVINVGSSQSYYDISVGQAMIAAWRQWKTGHAKGENEAAYRLTEDIRRIFGFNRLEINPGANDETLQVFVNGRSYKLAELGAGITQFFLVLANAAVKKPSYILIDEPELNLHPSLQLDFLTTLGSYASAGVLFATHSIGLARASSNRVYSVQTTDVGCSKVASYEETPRLAEFLGELSFSGYKDLGFDKILLVEGSTEVQTVQQMLRLYGKDHQVVLLPLGGASMIRAESEAELAEIKRISDNVSALIDSERTSPNLPLDTTRAAFVDTCKRVGILCHVLERRAIENYLTDSAIKHVKGEKYRALAPYEPLKSASPAWAKAENWRIAREMRKEDLQGTDLGGFLDSL